jgi:hypothetical protein
MRIIDVMPGVIRVANSFMADLQVAIVLQTLRLLAGSSLTT